jgi:hypothetical protein
MKTRRLLEVDLARLSPLPQDEQRKRMQRLIGGGARFSFKPTRDQFADILNSQPPIFASLGTTPTTDFDIIETRLKKECRSVEELIFNIQAARLLHSHFRAQGVVSHAFNFGSLSLGLERGIQYWVQSFYARNDLPVITFIDPRGGQGLTKSARDIVFSAMHASIRERYPDFADAVLEIVQLPYETSFSKRVEGMAKPRVLRTFTLTGAPTYSFEQIDRLLTATLRIWDEVCAEAVAETRRRAGGKGTLI